MYSLFTLTSCAWFCQIFKLLMSEMNSNNQLPQATPLSLIRTCSPLQHHHATHTLAVCVCVCFPADATVYKVIEAARLLGWMDYFHDLHSSIILNLILILFLTKLSLHCRIFLNIYCLKQCLRWIWKSKRSPTALKIRNVIHAFLLIQLPLIKGNWPLTKGGTEWQHMLLAVYAMWIVGNNLIHPTKPHWLKLSLAASSSGFTSDLKPHHRPVPSFHVWLQCLISLCLSAVRPIPWPRCPFSRFHCS